MPKPAAENTLESLYESLKTQMKNAEHPALLNALNEINQYTAKLRKPDKYKRIPYVTQADKEKLMELHERVAAESETVLKQNNSKEVKQLMEKIFALSSKSFTNISGYDPSLKPKSVDTIDEELRALHLDMGRSKTKAVGKTLSQRKIISFLDEKGRRVNGVFTPKLKDAVYDTISDKLYNIAQESNSLIQKDIIMSVLGNLADPKNLPENTILKSDNYAALYTLMSSVTDYNPANHGFSVNTEKLKSYLAKLNKMRPGELVNKLGADVLEQIESLLEPYATQVMANMEQAGISDDSRIDTRNAAMSAVADLLGQPNLLARSRPMKLTVLDENGKPVELDGTFMVEAKGIDLNNRYTKTELLKQSAIEGTDGNAFRQLADLQVLDFICGNVDRHMGNIFYQIDEKTGKLTGIQGIDNDCSFGEFVPKGGESRRRLAGLDNMRCISESMKNRVLALKAPTLKYALRGYGLTEKQLDAACARLERMQDAIQKSMENPVVGETKDGKPLFVQGRIRILPDEQFRKLDLKDLVVKTDLKGKEVPKAKEHGNIFSCAYTAITDAKNRQVTNVSYQLRGDVVLNAENRCRVDGLETAQNDAGRVQRMLERNTKLFHSSGKYRDMESAAKDLFNYQKKILTRVSVANSADVKAEPNYSQQLNAIVKPEEVEKMAKLAEKLEKAAERYLSYKGISTGAKKLGDYSGYTQGRIEAAQDILKIAKLYKTVKPEEADLAKVSQRQAMEEIARKKGDAKDPAMRNQAQKAGDAPVLG